MEEGQGRYVLIFARNENPEWLAQARAIAAERCPGVRIRVNNPKYIYADSACDPQAGVIICLDRDTLVVAMYAERQPGTRRIVITPEGEDAQATPESGSDEGDDAKAGATQPVGSGTVSADHRQPRGRGAG
jgi:hypothetical protein